MTTPSQSHADQFETLLQGTPESLREGLEDVHPEDFADYLRGIELPHASRVLAQLPPEYAAKVFERLDEDVQAALVEPLGLEATARIAVEMAADDRADFVSLIPDSMSRRLLVHLEREDPDLAEEVEQLTRWPEATAGSLMTTDYISLPERLLVRDAIESLRRDAGEAETINAVFITNAEGLLSGVLPLRRMLLAEPGEEISEVMNHNVISVPPDLDQEEVARKLAKYDLNVMPVVGERGRLLGVITADDVLDVLTEEQSEDVHKLGAVEPITGHYFHTSFVEFLRKRAPWLLILFGGGLLTTQTLQAYEAALSQVTQLSFYLPLLISAGGNSGAQSSTLIIRGLAVGDVKASDWSIVLKRETLQGVVLGSVLAIIGVLRVWSVGADSQFAILIGTTIVSIVVLGCVVGSMTPLMLHRLKVDPATSSTPFIATVVDVVGIIVYLSLAQALLGMALSQAPLP